MTSDGVTLASASVDGSVRIWDLAKLEQRAALPHDAGVTSVALARDGKLLASGGSDGVVRLWDLSAEPGPTVLRHGHEVGSLAYSPDGRLLASGDFSGAVNLWNATTGKKIATLRGHSGNVGTLSFSPDGKTLVSAALIGNGRIVKLWDVNSRQTERQWIEDLASCSAFSPDGRLLAIGTGDWTIPGPGALKLYDPNSGETLATLAGHPRCIESVAFSPDGTKLVTASHDGLAKVWEVATGSELFVLSGHKNWVTFASFSPDAKRVATTSKDGTAKLWDAATGQELFTLAGHRTYVYADAFSPDSTTLATAGWDGTVELWDVVTGQERTTIKAHARSIWEVAFSPDGRTLATASRDGTVKLWRAATEGGGKEEDSLQIRASRIAQADAQEQRRTLADLNAYLAGKVQQGDLEAVSLATLAAEALERGRQVELAAEAYRGFAELIAKSKQDKFRELAKNMGGSARRLTLPGKPLDLEGTKLDGTPLEWAAYRGKVVLVAFWTADSPQCRPYLANTKKLYRLYHHRGFDVVGINLDEDKQKLNAYLQKQPLPWVVLHADGAGWRHPMAAYYGVSRVPTMLLVDQEGKVVSIRARGQELDGLLEQLLGPPYAPQGKLTLIDLQPKANWGHTQGLPNDPDNNLADLPGGQHLFGGVQFEIGGSVIQLAGKFLPEAPEKVEGILVNRRARRIYLLHAAQWGAGKYGVSDGTLIGQYQVRFADGAEQTIPIVCGEDVRDWWDDDEAMESTPRSTIAWTGSNARSRQKQKTIRLFLSVWENRRPDEKVLSIDYLSAKTAAAPFCVAMTIEEPSHGDLTPADPR
jgi:WD40 repeat protein/peroxiredoxin